MKTKKFVILLFVILLSCLPLTVYADNGQIIVHMTKTGYKYHTATCGHLRSDIPVTLYEAVIIYNLEPCSDCNPPLYDGEATTIKETPSPPVPNYEDNSINQQHNDMPQKTSDYIKVSDTHKLYNWAPTFKLLLFIFVIWMLLKIINQKLLLRKEDKKKTETNLLKEHKILLEYEYYFSIYAFYKPEDFIKIPLGSYVSNGLPSTKGRGKYGKYTVYASAKGTCFHKSSSCARTCRPINYIHVCNRKPCQLCVKEEIPEIQWYFDYIKIVKIKKKYNIP